jgi:signal transduction histidine kinase
MRRQRLNDRAGYVGTRSVEVPSPAGPDTIRLAYVAAFAVAALACFVSLRRVDRVDDPDTARGLAGLLLTSGGWSAAHVGFLAAPTDGLRLACYYAGLVVGFAAIGAWLYFCSAYTGRNHHREPGYRRLAVGVFLLVVAVKLTNPVHGLYFSAEAVATPFPHLAVDHHLLHWLAMGLSYALAAVGGFMLFELFAQTGSDTRPLVVLAGLTGLPVALSVAGRYSDRVVEMTYEPLGVAAFALGVLFVYLGRFQTVQLAGDVDDPVVVLDEGGEIRDSNARARELFPELEGALGEPLEAVLPAVADRLDGDAAVLELERGGATALYRVSTNPFTFGNTRVGRLVLLSDVTETERYRREIERQNERLGQFAGVVSHDLRNPLAVAKGRVDLARESEEVDDAVHDDLEAAAAALDRMDRLVEDVLALARQGVDVGELYDVSMAETAERSWGTVDAPEAELVVDGDLSFRADPDRLRQLLENLFRNAVDHGGADVTVTVGRLAADDGFYVADHGPGVPPAEREAVFEFGETSAEDGSGLGLVIVATIADAHGWTRRVTDAAGGGARFEFADVERPEGESGDDAGSAETSDDTGTTETSDGADPFAG